MEERHLDLNFKAADHLVANDYLMDYPSLQKVLGNHQKWNGMTLDEYLNGKYE